MRSAWDGTNFAAHRELSHEPDRTPYLFGWANLKLPLKPGLNIQANPKSPRSLIKRGLRQPAPTRNGLVRRRAKQIHYGATAMLAQLTRNINTSYGNAYS